MTLSVLGPFDSVTSTVTTVSINSLEEDPSKKIRKPYTITKSRESWTDPEHEKFLEALHLFDRDWKKIEAFVGSKTVIQIRSHAQKYFLKVQKSGTNEHLPPPRPKRKAAHPYPQKASKYDQAPFDMPSAFLFSSALPEPGIIQVPDSLSMLKSPTASASISTWTNNSVRTAKISHGRQVPTLANNSCSTTKSTPTAQRFGEKTDQGNESHQLRVYSFIGSIFDPKAKGHLQNLKTMDRIDVETVLLLTRNLSINLTSPDFEDYRKLLSS